MCIPADMVKCHGFGHATKAADVSVTINIWNGPLVTFEK